MPIFKAAPRIASEYAADGKRIFDPVGLNELKAARFESWLDSNGINYFENTGLDHRLPDQGAATAIANNVKSLHTQALCNLLVCHYD